MHLNKSSKIALGIVTFLPFLAIAGVFLIAFYQAFSFFISPDPMMPMLLFSYLGYIIPYIFFFFLLYLGLGIFYLVHIVQNGYLDNEKKLLWIVLLIILNGLVMPAYWYVHIWKDKLSKDPEPNHSFDPQYESRIES